MVGHFLLFLFIAVVMIDPTNTLFHAKELTFALLMFFSVLRFKPDLSYIPHILIIAAALLLGYLSAEMQGNAMDNEMLAGTFKNIALTTITRKHRATGARVAELRETKSQSR